MQRRKVVLLAAVTRIRMLVKAKRKPISFLEKPLLPKEEKSTTPDNLTRIPPQHLPQTQLSNAKPMERIVIVLVFIEGDSNLLLLSLSFLPFYLHLLDKVRRRRTTTTTTTTRTALTKTVTLVMTQHWMIPKRRKAEVLTMTMGL